jgi:Flp pilus assembly protein TadB
MTKSPSTLGIILFGATMIVFFVVYYFFSGVNYFDISLKINAFVLPIMYAGTAFWSVKSYWNNNRQVSFKQAFNRAFVPMFVGGILSIFSIFAYLNFVDTDAKKLLNYQYVQRQKSELDQEYTSARKILKHQKDIDELDQKYKERLQSFTPKAVKGKDMLTASHFSGYFAAILIFYVVLSVFFGAFFRTKTIYQEETNQE